MSAQKKASWIPEKWTHRYRYTIEHCYGKIATGTVQVAKAMANDEVLALAKKMSNALHYDARIVNCVLVDKR
jgi:hypothetical protein